GRHGGGPLMRRRVASALIAVLLPALVGAATAQAAPTFVPIASGQWNQPMYLTAPPQDPSRLFVVQRAGLVPVVRNGTLPAQPFADLTGQVGLGGERGLLSI